MVVVVGASGGGLRWLLVSHLFGNPWFNLWPV